MRSGDSFGLGCFRPNDTLGKAQKTTKKGRVYGPPLFSHPKQKKRLFPFVSVFDTVAQSLGHNSAYCCCCPCNGSCVGVCVCVLGSGRHKITKRGGKEPNGRSILG